VTDARPPEGRYLALLGARVAATRSVLCLGIDPDVEALPVGFSRDLAGVSRFAALVLEAGAPFASAVKVNLAFFEAWGSAGSAALERLRSLVPADLPFIADAKRGDIGSTSQKHAMALFDVLAADAVTVSPYLGPEAIAPLLDRPDRFVYLLCRTSNPDAAALQGLMVEPDAGTEAPREPLAMRVARLASGWARHPGTLGLVVGATAPLELAAVRDVAPTLPFLVPGVGSQGGEADTALRLGPAPAGDAAQRPGGGLLINVSRGIAAAALGAPDPGVALSDAARRWSATLQVLG
jgi:orotidine-5'-phosphate decarboxylase